MHKASQIGPGGVDVGAIRDSKGKGLLPVQVSVAGTVSYRLMARVSPEAPWFTLKDAQTGSLLEAVSWVPYFRLEVTSGDGRATLWIGEE